MPPDQLPVLALIVAAIGFVLLIGGIFGDSWDARERRDARERNRRR